MGLIGTMTECGYIAASEPAHIPVNTQGAKGVLYGPLEDFPLPPDAVLLWLTPAQAMVWSEAAGRAEWGGAPPAIFTGRPACAAIPAALASGSSSQIGRASCRDRVCPYVWISVGAGSLKKKKKKAYAIAN